MDVFLSKHLPCAYMSSDVVWLRLWEHGYGICLKRTPLLFSERYGYRKTYKIGFGWRVSFLWRGK
jgi:hypothetical protein